MKVVLTREPPRNDALRSILELAIDVDEVPATTTNYFQVADVVAACQLLPRTVIVTSARAVEAAVALVTATAPEMVVAVGVTTASRLTELGVVDVQVASEEGARGVALFDFPGPVATIGAATTRPELGVLLRERGLESQHVAAYETKGRTLGDDETRAVSSADFVVVAAPSAWSVVRPFVAPDATVVVRGQTTFEAVSADHFRVVIAPSDTDTVATILGRALEA